MSLATLLEQKKDFFLFFKLLRRLRLLEEELFCHRQQQSSSFGCPECVVIILVEFGFKAQSTTTYCILRKKHKKGLALKFSSIFIWWKFESPQRVFKLHSKRRRRRKARKLFVESTKKSCLSKVKSWSWKVVTSVVKRYFWFGYFKRHCPIPEWTAAQRLFNFHPFAFCLIGKTWKVKGGLRVKKVKK